MNEAKDFSDIEKSWSTLLDQLSPAGNDFQMYGIRPRNDAKYFNARVERQHIVIDVARTHVNSSKITVERSVCFKEFEIVASNYNEYVSRVTGMRQQMQSSQNSSYLISLIHHLL